MRFRGPRKHLATRNSVIQALKFNSLELFAFYGCSKTTAVNLSHTRVMGVLCVFLVAAGGLCVCTHVDMEFLE